MVSANNIKVLYKMDKLKVKINNDENFQLIVSEPYFADYQETILFTNGFNEHIGKEIDVQTIGVVSGHETLNINNISKDDLLSICIPPIPPALSCFKEDLCNSYVLYTIKACELDLDINNVSVFYPLETLTIKVDDVNGMLETTIVKK